MEDIGRAYQRGYLAGYQAGLVAGKCCKTDSPDFMEMPLESLGLSARPRNCLHAYGCKTIGDVVQLPQETILKMRNLGKKSATEILRSLHDHQIFGSAWDFLCD